MSSALEFKEAGFPQASGAAEAERPSSRTHLTAPVIRVLFDVLPEGGLPAGTFCATVSASLEASGTCVLLVQLAPVHLRSRSAKRSHLALLASQIQQQCFDRHRINVAEIYWSMAGGNFQPTRVPETLSERQRIDQATYVMLERAIKEGPLRQQPENRRARRRPRFA